MSNLDNVIVENIKARMKSLSLSQVELARQAGIPHQSIYKILKGLRSPTLQMIEKISPSLQCTPDELLKSANSQNNFSKEDLLNVFYSFMKTHQEQTFFSELTKATPSDLKKVVNRFGGWNFLFDYLIEELEIRKEARNDYIQLRDSLNEKMNTNEVSETKRKMIISKMISNSTEGQV